MQSISRKGGLGAGGGGAGSHFGGGGAHGGQGGFAPSGGAGTGPRGGQSRKKQAALAAAERDAAAGVRWDGL